MEKKLLLLSQDQDFIAAARETLQPAGYAITLKQRLSSGLRAMRDGEVVLMDLPDAASSIREIRSYFPDALVIALAESGSRGKTVNAGAQACLGKPPDPLELTCAVGNAFAFAALREELDRVKGRELPSLVMGKGSRMQKVLRQLERAARKDVPVLVSGEQGTGREYVARAIHHGSPRRHGPFVPVEASPAKLEARLFGGGASPAGISRAEGGTLFIKGLDGLDGPVKNRLSAFLKDRRPPPADLRVICSANGTLKKDPLLAGFGVLLKLPPLRERPGDILPLAEHFLGESAGQFDMGEKTLSKDAGKALLRHDWPGNVGELKSTVTMACLLSGGSQIEARHIRAAEGPACYSVGEFLEAKVGRYLKEMAKLRRPALHDTVMGEVEKALIGLVLKETGGNQVRAAQALGITRTTLRSKIKGYKIKVK